jgi:hypothetical protein
MGIFSHLVFYLITHSRDIAIAPFISRPKFGLGLYANLPVPAFILEIGYGTTCWWIYGGSVTLLAIILLFNIANLPMFVATIRGAKQKMSNSPVLITTVVFVQILVTLPLVGLVS